MLAKILIAVILFVLIVSAYATIERDVLAPLPMRKNLALTDYFGLSDIKEIKKYFLPPMGWKKSYKNVSATLEEKYHFEPKAYFQKNVPYDWHFIPFHRMPVGFTACDINPNAPDAVFLKFHALKEASDGTMVPCALVRTKFKF